jgi:hypothetical protein
MGRRREGVDNGPTEEEAKVDDGHLGRHVSMFDRCNDGSLMGLWTEFDWNQWHQGGDRYRV